KEIIADSYNYLSKFKNVIFTHFLLRMFSNMLEISKLFSNILHISCVLHILFHYADSFRNIPGNSCISRNILEIPANVPPVSRIFLEYFKLAKPFSKILDI